MSKYKVSLKITLELDTPVDYVLRQKHNAIKKKVIKGLKEGTIKLEIDEQN
jgi:hypothetical protein